MQTALVPCNDYAAAYEAMKQAVAAAGGIRAGAGSRVVIKPNLVSRKSPDEAATTHPEILRAVIRLLEEAGVTDIIIAESPGGAYSKAVLKSFYATCGVDEAISGTCARLNYDTEFREVQYPEGVTMRTFAIIEPILTADLIISLPKLKTHSMTAYTGAVKNLFGVIPGTHKAELHFRLDDRDAFSSMLVDLYECVNRVPVLSVMDGVIGMEGDGPTAGKNRFIGLVGASYDAHALDCICARVIGYSPTEVPTIREAVKRGLVSEDIEPDVGTIEEFYIPDFVKPQTHFNLLRLLNLPPSLNSRVIAMLAARPDVEYSECVGCGECMRDCPPKAIAMPKGKPVIDRDKCIKCFCCQELCPKKAIKIKRSVFNRLMLKILK